MKISEQINKFLGEKYDPDFFATIYDDTEVMGAGFFTVYIRDDKNNTVAKEKHLLSRLDAEAWIELWSTKNKKKVAIVN